MTVDISEATVADLRALGITDFTGLLPDDLFSWTGLASAHAHEAAAFLLLDAAWMHRDSRPLHEALAATVIV